MVELDGSQHLDMTLRDEQRTKYLEGLGFRVVRFWDNEALESTDEVIEEIGRLLKDPLASPRPRAGGASPPAKGSFRGSR